ncbi:MAG TPA: WYL domain-containing protein, partial [Flavisolibacter sp.]
KAVLRRTEKHQIASLDDHIAVVAHPMFVHSKPTELHLSKILPAIAGTTLIEFGYTSVKGENLRRKAEPIGIYYQGSHWYLVAFCLLRKDYRNFRTDRIQGLQPTGEKMTLSHPPLQNFLLRVTEKKDLQKVVIEVNAAIVNYLGEQKYYNGFVGEEKRGNKVRMTFLTCSLSGFARWFLLFGDEATILEPLDLQDTVSALAEKILQKMEANRLLLT